MANCTKCDGFGFYTIVNSEGVREGRRCDQHHGPLKQFDDAASKYLYYKSEDKVTLPSASEPQNTNHLD